MQSMPLIAVLLAQRLRVKVAEVMGRLQLEQVQLLLAVMALMAYLLFGNILN
jgi:hypothetical protein